MIFFIQTPSERSTKQSTSKQRKTQKKQYPSSKRTQTLRSAAITRVDESEYNNTDKIQQIDDSEEDKQESIERHYRISFKQNDGIKHRIYLVSKSELIAAETGQEIVSEMYDLLMASIQDNLNANQKTNSWFLPCSFLDWYGSENDEFNTYYDNKKEIIFHSKSVIVLPFGGKYGHWQGCIIHFKPNTSAVVTLVDSFNNPLGSKRPITKIITSWLQKDGGIPANNIKYQIFHSPRQGQSNNCGFFFGCFIIATTQRKIFLKGINLKTV